MLAGYLYGAQDLRFVEEEPPRAPDGHEVLIRVSFSGICGTDLHRWRGSINRELPAPLGHEYSGIVESIGPDVARVSVGDRVAVHPYVFCERCAHCRNGRHEYCEAITHFPLGLSQFALVHEKALHVLPEDMSLEVGTLLEPLAACLHAVEVGDIRPGCNVLVLGGGPIGLLCAALARVSGAAFTVVAEPSTYRRELALALGVDAAIDPGNDLTARLREELGGATIDVVFDCVTNSGSLDTAVQVLTGLGPRSRAEQWATDQRRYACRLVVVGNAPAHDQWTLPEMDIVHYAGLDIRGATMRGDIGARALRLLHRLDLAPLITHTFGRGGIDDAFELLENGNAGKILISPWAQ